MRAAGLQGLQPRRFVTTTVTEAGAERSPDHVERQFGAAGPDRLWVADIMTCPAIFGPPEA
jgi:hypothetical protein